MNKKDKKTHQPIFHKVNKFIRVLLGLSVSAVLFYMASRPNLIPISEQKLSSMLQQAEVRELAFIPSQNLVEISLTPEALEKPLYKQELANYHTLFVSKQGPHYALKVPSAEVFNTNFKALEAQLPKDKAVGYITKERLNLLNWLYPLLLILVFLFFMQKLGSGIGPGGHIFNFAKSKAMLFDKESVVKVGFANVAGLREAKEELQEIVAFLKDPAKFTKLGGKIPKGVLLIGPPGTGKTLLGRAVAGEADVPFFYLSGTDFVEMFVGVGAARVRDLFNQAKEAGPCIIFIDEIDAVGRSRSKNQMWNVNEEKENTLNALLVEMDGFETDKGVIVLGASNRPETLDPALVRPGRFDRQIYTDVPDIKDRTEIFALHMQPLVLVPDINPQTLAEHTPGFVGADIANICNEAALLAARQNKKAIELQDFLDAIDRVLAGPEKKNRVISPKEKEIIAYHEAGHALSAWYLEHTQPLVKVSIIPRGRNILGYAQYLPKEQHIYQKEQLFDEICMALGGRIAESLFFHTTSTGAWDDLFKATKMAHNIVAVYGMNEKIGYASFYDPKNKEDYSFMKPYSEATAQIIDEQIKAILALAYDRVYQLLFNNKDKLELIANILLKKEVLLQQDLEELIGKRPFPISSKEDIGQDFVDNPKQALIE